MKIEGTSKEIADLILRLQGQQKIKIDTNNFSQIIHETTEDDFPNSVDKLISKIASSIHSKMEKEEIHALAALIEARAKVPVQNVYSDSFAK